ncbi:hypothetical protein AB6A40_004181 [Gnathostoma spinigerum]|uniref:Uncharacterized protein n=1 Tax=Gnathostoma spinigerum TaxID=75299 RepID=A0ABD6EDX2_9BILA
MSQWLIQSPLLASSVIFVGVVLLAINIGELRNLQTQLIDQLRISRTSNATVQLDHRPVAWIRGRKMENGHLKHIIEIFQRLGFKVIKGNQPIGTKFDVLWNHEYPFNDPEIRPMLNDLRPYQKVNHIPGSGFYTSKVSLSTSVVHSGIPLSFELPSMMEEFKEYANEHPEMLWVKKSNEHRGIRIQKTAELDLNEENSFVQQYVANPFLIDGKKFDIGIYTVITSIAPLRVYIYEGDALLRFCSQPYHPFDPENVDGYVVGDDYTPTWEMPSLKPYYIEQQMTYRETLNAYIRSLGKDPEPVWFSMKETIAEVFEAQQKKMNATAFKYRDQRSFFELSRFDFILDKDLNVYLMEANMSPNLSTGHFPQNRLLYEQVIINVLSLVGVASHLHGQSFEMNFKDKKIREMSVSPRDLRIFGDECISSNSTCYGKKGCTTELRCRLCGHCMTYAVSSILRCAYREHVHRYNMRRALPTTTPTSKNVNKMYSETDRLLILWFVGKCRQDKSWCY